MSNQLDSKWFHGWHRPSQIIDHLNIIREYENSHHLKDFSEANGHVPLEAYIAAFFAYAWYGGDSGEVKINEKQYDHDAQIRKVGNKHAEVLQITQAFENKKRNPNGESKFAAGFTMEALRDNVYESVHYVCEKKREKYYHDSPKVSLLIYLRDLATYEDFCDICEYISLSDLKRYGFKNIYLLSSSCRQAARIYPKFKCKPRSYRHLK